MPTVLICTRSSVARTTACKGGVPVIALPSTATGGIISRIVPRLDDGAGGCTRTCLGASAVDADGDGLCSDTESSLGTSDALADSDGDGILDKDEGIAPDGGTLLDTDNDGTPNFRDKDDDNDLIDTKDEILDTAASGVSDDVAGQSLASTWFGETEMAPTCDAIEAVTALERLRERVADDARGVARAHEPKAGAEVADEADAFHGRHERHPGAREDFSVNENVRGLF